LIAAGKFDGINSDVNNISLDVLDHIDCVGDDGNYN
jgi:hypothetical protein